MPEIRKLWSKKNSVIFVWPGEEPLSLQYDGLRIVVPPRDVIGRVGGVGSIYTHEAAELKGRKLPGTAVVEDVTVLTAEGGYKTVLSIDHLCRYLTRDRDDLFARGFNIVESPEMIEEAVLLGIPLYGESQVKRAREVLARELHRQKAYKDRGETPPPSTSEHLIAWAVKHLRGMGPQAQAHRMEDLSAVLEGRAAPEAPAPSEFVQKTLAGTTAKLEALAEAQQAFAEANELGVGLNNFELKALLTGSEDTIAKVKTKIAARRLEMERERAEAVATASA